MIDDAMLARARSGEVIHLRKPPFFKPLKAALEKEFQAAAGQTGSFEDLFTSMSWDEFQSAFAVFCAKVDDEKTHYTHFVQEALSPHLSRSEGICTLPFSKSCRVGIPGVGKMNYGYQIHRDSWFDLSPDGINVVLYLTSVNYSGNTAFYLDQFGKPQDYDPVSRQLKFEDHLTSVTAHNCAAGDVLVFNGDQLHSGGLREVLRFSLEFRLSRLWNYGRPDQNIRYVPLSTYENQKENAV